MKIKIKHNNEYVVKDFEEVGRLMDLEDARYWVLAHYGYDNGVEINITNIISDVVGYKLYKINIEWWSDNGIWNESEIYQAVKQSKECYVKETRGGK